METKKYLAYGSNMDLGQMSYRCPGAILLGAAKIEDHRLLFKGSKTGSYATIEPCAGCSVPVLVWDIDERDEESLDVYEGYPRFYRKENLAVRMRGAEIEAMAYVMDESRPLGIPSARYYGVIEDAYERFGFDKRILEKALADSCAVLG